MRILLIGGSGLISTAITRQLGERGDRITLFNRGKTPLHFSTQVEQLIGDRTQFADFEALIAQQEPFDCVIDMVCYTTADAESAVRAFRGRTQQYIFCSTVDVYTKGQTFPIYENATRYALNNYGKQKALCEDIFLEAHARGDFAVTILRPAHTYGEGSTIIHSLGWRSSYIDRIRKGKPIIVHGDGQSLWVSCHVDDVARGFIGAIHNERAYGKAYHVTGEEWRTWNRYHEQVAEALHAPKPTLVHIPTDLLGKVARERAFVNVDNFQFNNIFDNTAARTDLHFRYTIPWVEGVRRTVAWLDEHNRIDNSDNDPYDDRIIAAWEKASTQMANDLVDL